MNSGVGGKEIRFCLMHVKTVVKAIDHAIHPRQFFTRRPEGISMSGFLTATKRRLQLLVWQGERGQAPVC
jgi:hypothetical protein